MANEGKVREIRSPDNPRFKAFLKLLKPHGIRKQGNALISGSRYVDEVLRDFPEYCEAVISCNRHGPAGLTLPEHLESYCISTSLFRELDVYGTDSPMLLVRVPEIASWREELSTHGCTLFVPFQDPTNIGAVVRSAAAFGVQRVVLLEEAAHPFHPRSVRAAGSTLFRVRMERGPSIEALKAVDLPLVALSTQGREIFGYRFPARFGLVVGLEGLGLPEERGRWEAVSIPMEAGVESLNAAVAAGIALYSWKEQLKSEVDEHP